LPPNFPVEIIDGRSWTNLGSAASGVLSRPAEWFAILAVVWNSRGAITSPADSAEAVRPRWDICVLCKQQNTDKLSGVFIPNATVIARPKVVRRAPLNKAPRRVLQPRTKRRPKGVSAAVAIIANAGVMAAGKTN